MANDATVFLHGNIVRDPEVREVGPNKSKVTSFTVAVSTTNKRPDGTYDTNYYDVSFWGPRGEAFAERAGKGTAVAVVGDLCLSEYVSQKDNQKHSRLRVECYKVKITSQKKEADGAQAAARKAAAAPMPEADDPFGG
jgi:single stranded DNA-binding protein